MLATIPEQKLSWSAAANANVDVYVRRDDLIHPGLGGNKLYKLWGHIQAWKTSGKQALVSCGGPYSNHLYALAAFGQLAGVRTCAMIRGERPKTPSQTLIDIENMGMELIYVSRTEYRQKPVDKWLARCEDVLDVACFWVPEGGGGELGMDACQVLGEYLADQHWNRVLQACGTGTTLIGLARGLITANSKTELIGVSSLRSRSFIVRSLLQSLPSHNLNWSLSNQAHMGGYAKVTSDLENFKINFERETGVDLDKVYTSKVFYALSKMLKSGCFEKGERVLVIHSGGLQGNRKLRKDGGLDADNCH
jgi:1-aminocyclopropane-1-carboxylate deaminase